MESISENAGGGQTAVKKKSWRDVYKVHPAADLFPMLPEDELRKLGEDIKANGLTDPIVFWSKTKDSSEDQYLLDGRNRLAAMELVGLSTLACKKILYYGHEVDPHTFIVSKNIHRRHLTKEQQADLIVKVMKAGTDFAKLARSVKRNSNGRVQGSKKDPIKEKAVTEGKKHGISKRTVERAIAKDKGPTKKPPKTNFKAIVKASEKMKLQQGIDAGWTTPEQAQRHLEQIEKKSSGQGSDESRKIDKSVLYIVKEVDRIIRTMRADSQKLFVAKLILALDSRN